MSLKSLENRIEALLFTRNTTLTTNAISKALGADKELIEKALKQLVMRYEKSALAVIEIASGWRMQLHESYFDEIAALNEIQVPKYSRAFWETIAYVAYHQPVTRSDIDAVRGVSTSSGIYRQLFDLEWIAVVGQREVPGRPDLLATTQQFLDDFALKKASDLPSLSDDIVEGDDK